MAEKPIKKLWGVMKITETKNYIRLRIMDPKLFKKSSFRTQDVGRKGHMKRITARLKVNNEWETQSWIFNKDDLGRDEALRRAEGMAEVERIHRGFI